MPTTQSALQATQVLIEFLEAGNSGVLGTEYLRTLERLERLVKVKQANEGIQGTLDSWIT